MPNAYRMTRPTRQGSINITSPHEYREHRESKRIQEFAPKSPAVGRKPQSIPNA